MVARSPSHAFVIGAVVASVAMLVACASKTVQDPLEDLDTEQKTPSKKTTSSSGGETTVNKADASVPDSNGECTTVPPNNRCGLVPQCGCGANETCDVTNETTGATSCVSGGSATLGRPCTQTGDCMAGLTCDFGACRPYCSTPRSKCGVAGTDLCVEVLDSADKPITNKAVCTINCDPRSPQGVCGTNACLWFPTYYNPSKISDCNFAGTVQPYAAECQGDGDCTQGHACIDHPKIGFECERWCRIGVAGDCPTSPANLKCKDVLGANAPVISGQKLGVCQD